jgi:predicted AAA+ superfamily ATPase
MVDGYAKEFGLDIATAELHAEAIEWAATRGARSGRVAWQFIQDVAGRLGARLADQGDTGAGAGAGVDAGAVV